MNRNRIQIICIAAGALIAGYVLRGIPGAQQASPGHKVLYYVDPMHPAYKSDKPGIAPDCGMQLEPVYADGKPGGGSTVTSAIRISREKQQLLGLSTITVSRQAGQQKVRVIGRVAAEDNRTQQIAALADGVIRSVSGGVPGAKVRKDELLATYFVYLRDVYTAIQAYFVAMSALDQRSELAAGRGGAMDNSGAQLRKEEELLKAYGITEPQIQELARTREITRDIQFRSPITGVILSRNAYVGQKVDRGTELFRVADLSRVWVIADVFENESGLLRPGAAAEVHYNGRTWHGLMVEGRQVDPISRTTRVRLEVTNPDLFLRPDTVVDVEFNLRGADCITAPLYAVLDSGRRKSVFVATGDESFAPREITTGDRYGDRVAILTGLKDGETIAANSLFLLDSESRLQQGSEGHAGTLKPAASAQLDPVCGMDVEASKSEWQSIYQGRKYYFCSRTCKEQFDKNPGSYMPKTLASKRIGAES